MARLPDEYTTRQLAAAATLPFVIGLTIVALGYPLAGVLGGIAGAIVATLDLTHNR